MNQCPLRGSEGTYKPRSQVGWYMGSHYRLQSLVGLVIRCVHLPYRRMDCVQAGSARGCLSLGGWALPICARVRAGDPRPTTRQERDPLPPTPHGSVRGNPINFPYFFVEWGLSNFSHIPVKAVSLFFYLLDNTQKEQLTWRMK